MHATIDGNKLSTFRSFTDEVAKALAAQTGERPYFGWDLSSFEDCLCGGFIGKPPYEIVVENAEAMLLRFDHTGLARYCDYVLDLEYPPGGRLLDPVLEEHKAWFINNGSSAQAGIGPTLLDYIFKVIQHRNASITLRSKDGQIIHSVIGTITPTAT